MREILFWKPPLMVWGPSRESHCVEAVAACLSFESSAEPGLRYELRSAEVALAL